MTQKAVRPTAAPMRWIDGSVAPNKPENYWGASSSSSRNLCNLLDGRKMDKQDGRRYAILLGKRTATRCAATQ